MLHRVVMSLTPRRANTIRRDTGPWERRPQRLAFKKGGHIYLVYLHTHDHGMLHEYDKGTHGT